MRLPAVGADVVAGARLVRRLPLFLRRPVEIEEARRELRRRFETRDATFLDLVRRTIYARPRSPYAQLLRHAGCAYGDLARLVGSDGVEGALRALMAAGVYLTVEELRGRQPAYRGAAAIEVDSRRLRNPLVDGELPMQTGGSRSAGTPVGWSLAFVRDRAVDLCLAEAARGAARRRSAIWSVPGSAAIAHLLDIPARGGQADRWFCPVDPTSQELPIRYRWSVRAIRAACRLGGTRLPAPVHVPLLAPEPIVDWLASVLRAGDTPYLHTRPSAVLRIAESAARRGVDLGGTEVAIGGEPITPARAGAMHRAGLRVLPRYAAVEVGLIGDACLAPRGSDDVHILHDLIAAIQPTGQEAPAALPPGALCVSSLRPSAPWILLNASMGDRGVLDSTACGCPVAALGWTTTLRSIVSFEKLTGAGMTFHDTDVVRILDETLPARFGGGAGDYQLVEDESPEGQPRLRLLVHPAVGTIEPRTVAAAFLAALGPTSDAAGVMARVWRDAGILTVERAAPRITRSGKVLHLHRARSGFDRPD